MKKVVLITGASSGIGKETARQLVREGHTVYGAARRLEKMEDLKADGIIPLAMDITQPEQIESVVKEILDREGRIDVLVNNAGYGLYGAVEDIPIEDARYQFEVNLFGLARLTQLVLPSMREAKSGTIFNVSSVGGKIYTPMGAWYHATKHALEGWSDSLRMELEPHGIDVVIIEPGAIETEFGNVMSAPMLERSGSGPYADIAKAMAKSVDEFYTPGNSSPPSVVSNAISKAVKAKRPRTRYMMGKFAKPLFFLRRLLSDRLFDRVLRSF
ncbi:MAG: oxidoreductase [Verrucomicrobiota bacterium]